MQIELLPSSTSEPLLLRFAPQLWPARNILEPPCQFFHHLPMVFGSLVSWMQKPTDLTVSMILNDLVPLSKLMAEQITTLFT